MDPKYYPEPEEFRPERFSSDISNGGNQKGVTYMPFGDGPRACIGLRMGKLQAKIGIVLIMSKFNLRLGEKLQNMKKLKYEVKMDNDYEAFIFKMVKDTMNYREKNNVHRKDFMQLLLQLKNTGKVDYSDDWNIQSDAIKFKIIE
uniref:Cytochrome n=1 Tax=Lutzomyia longipalpis TaxID=7200 RepID=A0A1B0CII3_LUTLO